MKVALKNRAPQCILFWALAVCDRFFLASSWSATGQAKASRTAAAARGGAHHSGGEQIPPTNAQFEASTASGASRCSRTRSLYARRVVPVQPAPAHRKSDRLVVSQAFKKGVKWLSGAPTKVSASISRLQRLLCISALVADVQLATQQQRRLQAARSRTAHAAPKRRSSPGPASSVLPDTSTRQTEAAVCFLALLICSHDK